MHEWDGGTGNERTNGTKTKNARRTNEMATEGARTPNGASAHVRKCANADRRVGRLRTHARRSQPHTPQTEPTRKPDENRGKEWDGMGWDGMESETKAKQSKGAEIRTCRLARWLLTRSRAWFRGRGSGEGGGPAKIRARLAKKRGERREEGGMRRNEMKRKQQAPRNGSDMERSEAGCERTGRSGRNDRERNERKERRGKEKEAGYTPGLASKP